MLPLGTQVGVLKARMMAAEHRVPLIAIHHMEAHALVARLEAEAPFPFLALLISGGHNLLVVVRGVGDYAIIGATLDDALGEAYDKVGRMLGLDVGGGGGAVVEQLALEGDPLSLPLPVSTLLSTYVGTATNPVLNLRAQMSCKLRSNCSNPVAMPP
jgi:N6-L-threonylcarbamoyladenine synthase